MGTVTDTAVWESRSPELLAEIRGVLAAEAAWERAIAEMIEGWGFPEDVRPHFAERMPWRVWDGLWWHEDELPENTWRRHIGDPRAIVPDQRTGWGSELATMMLRLGPAADVAYVVQTRGMPLYTLCPQDDRTVHTPTIVHSRELVRVTWAGHAVPRSIGPDWQRAE